MNRKNTAVTPAIKFTLVEAVANTVKQLSEDGSFSAYDITTEIREAVNSGEYTIPVTTTGKENWINHEDVKAILDRFLDDGFLKTLGLTNVSYNGTFRVFEFDEDTAAVVFSKTPVAVTPPVNPNPTKSPLAQKIEIYLNKSVGTPVTLKQIQSAVKVNGISCKDFAELISNLGYNVNPGTPNKFSTYTVG